MGNESGDTSNPSSGTSTGSGGRGWIPPSVEELHALIPQYEIESLIGHGGMGAVYRGMQPALERPVAIKLLPETLAGSNDDANFVERFKLEARAMASLDHPAIISVHDFGQTPAGHLYFVMEFIDGMDMHKYIQLSGGSVEPDTAVAIVSHVLDALDYAHSKGIIHRDIKPANVLINREGKVKIADFGLAKKLTGDDEPDVTGLTMSNVAMGTPDFIAPEALDADAVADHRADLYAVGVMLFQMLTGKVPRGIFKLPSEENDEIDPRLDDILTLAMEADPEGRFQSASEFRMKLDELASTPVQKIEPDLSTREIEAPAAKLDFTEPGLRKSKVAKRRPSAAKKKGGAGLMVWAVVGSLVVGGLLFWWIVGSGKEEDSTGLSQAPDPVESGPSSEAAELDSEWIELITSAGIDDWKRDVNSDSNWTFENGAIWKRSGPSSRLSKEIEFGEVEIVGEFWTSPVGDGGVTVAGVAELCLLGSVRKGRPNAVRTGGIWMLAKPPFEKVGPEENLVPDNTWAEFRIRYHDGHFETWIDGKKVSKMQVGSAAAPRVIILEGTPYGSVAYRNIRIRPILDGEETVGRGEGASLPPSSLTNSEGGTTNDDWPTGPNFSQEGGFKAWSSIPNDPLIDLSRLRGIDDVKQVLIHADGWVVLQGNGETISSDGKVDRSGVKSIHPPSAQMFTLVFQDQEPVLFNGDHEEQSVELPQEDLRSVKDCVLAGDVSFAITESGELISWGDDEQSEIRWKVRPRLNTGQRAIWMSSVWMAHPKRSALAVGLDDGLVRVWTRAEGEILLPNMVQKAVAGGSILSAEGIRGYPIGGGAIRTFRWDAGSVLESGVPSDPVVSIARSSGITFCVFSNGTVGVSKGILSPVENSFPQLTKGGNPLAYIQDAQPNHIWVDTELIPTEQSNHRILWFDASSGNPRRLTESRGDVKILSERSDGLVTAPASVEPTGNEPPDISELSALKSAHQDSRRTQMAALLDKYRPALVRAEDAAIAAGELDRVEAIQTAIERADTFAASIKELSEMETVEPLPALPPLGERAPDELKRLRSIFDTEVAKIESNLLAQFEKSLEELQGNLVKAGRIEEARAVERYRVGLSGGSPLEPSVADNPTTEWTELFNGRDLSGWTPSDSAEWIVEGAGVRHRGDSVNSIQTTLPYAEFEIEGEFLVSAEGNGGLILPEILEMQLVGSKGFRQGGAWSGGLMGRGNNLGRTASPSSNPVKDGAWTPFRWTVESSRSSASVNGLLVGEMTLEPFPGVQEELVLQGMFQGEVGYRNLKIRPLDDTDSGSASYGEWTDILARIDPDRDRSTWDWIPNGVNRWKKEAGDLIFPEGAGPGEIQFPGSEGVENFQLRISFTREVGMNGFDLKIPTGRGATSIVLMESPDNRKIMLGRPSTKRGGIVASEGFSIENGQREELLFTFRATGANPGIIVERNGAIVTKWSGDYRNDIVRIEKWTANRLGLWIYANSKEPHRWRFHEILLKKLD